MLDSATVDIKKLTSAMVNHIASPNVKVKTMAYEFLIRAAEEPGMRLVCHLLKEAPFRANVRKLRIVPLALQGKTALGRIRSHPRSDGPKRPPPRSRRSQPRGQVRGSRHDQPAQGPRQRLRHGRYIHI